MFECVSAFSLIRAPTGACVHWLVCIYLYVFACFASQGRQTSAAGDSGICIKEVTDIHMSLQVGVESKNTWIFYSCWKIQGNSYTSCSFAWTVCSFKLSWHCGNALRQTINLQQDRELFSFKLPLSNTFTNGSVGCSCMLMLTQSLCLVTLMTQGSEELLEIYWRCEYGHFATLYYRLKMPLHAFFFFFAWAKVWVWNHFCGFIRLNYIKQVQCQTSLAFILDTAVISNLIGFWT